MRDLFEAIRKRCPSDAWSRGVTLARNGSASLGASSGNELEARISIPGSPVSPRVSLFPEAGEWECDCGSPLDACEHVAAAVIACVSARDAAPEPQRPILYRLKRSPEELLFERGVEDETGFRAIEFPLDALASGRLAGPRFDATREDLEVEKALRGTFRGVLAKGAVARVFEALARVSGWTTLDGRPVKVSPEPLVPVVRVEAQGDGFLVRLADGEDVTERFRNGVVLANGVLRPEGEPDLSGREREELLRGRFYRPEEVPELVGRVLPSLQKRVRVEVAAGKLPEAMGVPPRLSFLLERSGPNLRVLSRIVYPSTEVPLRDLDAEKKLEEKLRRDLGLRLDRAEEVRPEDAIELVLKLERFGAILEGDGRDSFRLHSDLVPSFRVVGSEFELSFTSGSRRADPRAVLGAFRGGRSLVALLGGGFAPIPIEWLELHGDQVEDLLAAREAVGSLPRASVPELARLAEDLDASQPADFAALRAVVSDFSELPPATLPDGVREALRGYQRQGVDWLVFLRKNELSALLADDMGLGKTIQVLAALESGRNLVVAPTSVLHNWIGEAQRFRPDLSLCFYYGPERTLDPSANLTLTSHALLRLDRDLLAAVSWDAVVLDEAQAIRNPETELARAAFALRARFRVSLTGTPIENRLVDLWSQFRFLHPGFLGGLSDFEERYVRPTAEGDEEPMERLRARIRPFFLRRLKREVAPELPPRTETTLRAELGEDERRLYDALRLAARKDALVLLERGGSVFSALEALLRLRQACCHPALVPGSTPAGSMSSKVELLLSNLETAAADGHKSLVFSQWTSMLDLLEPELERAGHSFVRLDGTTRDRAAVVDRFQNDPGVSVFLVSLKAGGVGLNLTAADHVFLFDPWWNPAAEEQAFDRAHRIGQEKPVFLYRLVAADTVEERILALQDTKRGLARTAVGERALTLTREDLIGLLEG